MYGLALVSRLPLGEGLLPGVAATSVAAVSLSPGQGPLGQAGERLAWRARELWAVSGPRRERPQLGPISFPSSLVLLQFLCWERGGPWALRLGCGAEGRGCLGGVSDVRLTHPKFSFPLRIGTTQSGLGEMSKNWSNQLNYFGHESSHVGKSVSLLGAPRPRVCYQTSPGGAASP